ncbi:MAG: metal-dependent phosphohydrolase region [Gemmatimonadetes bacterium]|nr:metal-dependent phosphohydrolase region [Gemmatimonadota bacterium]
MTNPLPLVLGAAGGALLAREHKTRVAMERFAGAALETLLNAIEANDPDTGMHVRRVAAYAMIIAEAAGLDEHRQHAVERVALFHDIGKIHEALFDIVHEPNKLTAAERRAIATHPARGAQVLAPLKAFYPELPAGVLAHHERWDGKGYPRGLRGRRIPLEARIVTIADTFDAVAHTRRYRRGTGVEKAFEVIAEGRATQFDPELVDVMLLPPVKEQIVREFDTRITPHGQRGGRRARRHESIPDVTFRWRSQSLGSSRLRAAHRVD